MYDNFLFRKSWWSILKTLPTEQRNEVIDCISGYMFDDILPEFPKPSAVSMAVQFIMQDILKDKERYDTTSEKRREAGRKGGLQRAGNAVQSVVASVEEVPAETADMPAEAEEEVDMSAEVTQANASKAKQMQAKPSKTKQTQANQAKPSKTKQTQANQAIDKEKEKEKNNTLSLSPSATPSGDDESGREREEAKQNVIFSYAMDLLSEGRPNAYSEAEQAYNYNDGFGWMKETMKPNGDVVKQRIQDKLAWLRSRKAKNEQQFPPADGMLMAEILRQTGCLPENRCIIDAFRGFRQNADNGVSMLYAPLGACRKLKEAIDSNPQINGIVFSSLRKVYPGTTGIDYRRPDGR